MPENQLWISWLVNLPPPLVSLNKALLIQHLYISEGGKYWGRVRWPVKKKSDWKFKFDFSELLGAFWLPNRLRDGRPKLIASGQAKSLEIPYWKVLNTLIEITCVASLMYIYICIYIYIIMYIYICTWLHVCKAMDSYGFHLYTNNTPKLYVSYKNCYCIIHWHR